MTSRNKQLSSLHDFVVFVRVVDTGSFSAAARSLDLAPPTISKQIARLEKQFGVSLFVRTTRQLRITDEGRAIATRVRSALALLDEATEIARTGTADVSGIIRITAPVPFGSRYVAAAAAAFRKLHPKVGFEMHLTDRIVDLYAGDVDVAIRVAHLNDSQLIARHLANNRRVLVASPDYVRNNGAPTHPDELSDHCCLLFSYPGLSRCNWLLQSRMTEKVIDISISSDLVSDNGSALRHWCIEGLGISLRDIWDVADDIRSGRLIHLLPEWDEQASPINFVRPRRHPVPKRISLFGEFLVRHWQRPPWES